jgi:hypothetical protein
VGVQVPPPTREVPGQSAVCSTLLSPSARSGNPIRNRNAVSQRHLPARDRGLAEIATDAMLEGVHVVLGQPVPVVDEGAARPRAALSASFKHVTNEAALDHAVATIAATWLNRSTVSSSRSLETWRAHPPAPTRRRAIPAQRSRNPRRRTHQIGARAAVLGDPAGVVVAASPRSSRLGAIPFT